MAGFSLDAIGIGAVADFAGKILDRFIPDKAAADAAKLAMFEAMQKGDLAQLAASTDLAKGQLEVNKAEAVNVNWFVSGWRPAVGWVCVMGLFYEFIMRPLATFGAHLAGVALDAPSLDIGALMTLLTGMLGLGAMRMVEKMNGVASK